MKEASMTTDLEIEIAETRAHLAETVDALAAKMDLKSRAQQSIASADKARLGAAACVMVAGAVFAVLLWRRA